MTDQLENEVIEDGVGEVVEAPKVTREDWEAKQRDKASRSGWKDFDDYVAEGGDPEKWKTADAFNIYGELVGTIKKNEREFDARLQGVQRLSEAQLAAQRAQLLEKRDNAIDNGDRAAVNAIEKQINTLNNTANTAPQAETVVQQWNEANPWVMEDSPKADRARSVFQRALQSGKDVHAAIADMEAKIAKEFPVNAPRTSSGRVPETERGNGSQGFKGKSAAVTMDSLTSEEASIWKHSSSMWNGDSKQFLQSVADMRKAAKGDR